MLDKNQSTGGIMIQPISSIRQNYDPTFKHYSFKGFYDPTCVSHIDPEASAKAYRAFLDAKTKIFEPIANSPLVKVSTENFKEKFLSDTVKTPIENFKEKFPLRFIKNAQDVPQQGSILKHILPDGVTTVEIPLDRQVGRTKLLDANNILAPNLELKSDAVLNELKASARDKIRETAKDILTAPELLEKIEATTGILPDGTLHQAGLSGIKNPFEDIPERLVSEDAVIYKAHDGNTLLGSDDSLTHILPDGVTVVNIPQAEIPVHLDSEHVGLMDAFLDKISGVAESAGDLLDTIG